MPTVGWVLENAIERFWAGQPKRPTPDPKPLFVCVHCGRKFFTPDERRSHISLEHPLELPQLYVYSKPFLEEDVIRVPMLKGDVDLVQCTYCEMQIDGGTTWHRLEVSEFCAQFFRTTNSTWNVRLVYERPMDGSQAVQVYHIRFRIPDTATLNTVDKHFLQTLVLDELRHSDLERFEAGLPADAPSREYGSALGDYALGILLKERRNLPRSQVRFEEFAVKMRSALEVLRLFHRPVALAVSSCIRFNLNDFHDHGVVAAEELETGLQFFRSITGKLDRSDAPIAPSLQKSSKPVCPVDKISHHLLSACAQLYEGNTMSLAEIEALRQLTRGMTPVSQQDLTKIHVICAESYLRIDRTADALPHLQAIQFDPSLKDWSQYQLDVI